MGEEPNLVKKFSRNLMFIKNRPQVQDGTREGSLGNDMSK